MIDAVLAVRPASPLDADERLQALKEFLRLPDAPLLTALNKRIGNILRKAQLPAQAVVEAAAFTEDAERRLHRALIEVRAAWLKPRPNAATARASRVSSRYLRRLPIFLNASWSWTRMSSAAMNRLALLRDAQRLLGTVADLSRLPG